MPRTGNLGVAWRHRSLSLRVAVNYIGTHITNFSAATPHRNLYRFTRKITNAGLAWHYRPSLTFTLDVSNLFNEPEAFYRGSRDRLQSSNIAGSAITVGANGRF
jgi:outer membrane receptor protein involved in Fe transport